MVSPVLGTYLAAVYCSSLLAKNTNSQIAHPIVSAQVFTTHHWMVRIYKLKDVPNRQKGTKRKAAKAVSRIENQV